ncbi:unnamed protein product [Rhizophagus irregularis]|nr:unnamed protein product [Rhizophagus irregularis]
MKCKKCVLKDIWLNFSREIDNKYKSSETSSILSSKKRKISNNQITLENFYNDNKIDEVKNGELANVTLKIKKELAKTKNLILCVNGWASLLKHSIYAFVIMTSKRK